MHNAELKLLGRPGLSIGAEPQFLPEKAYVLFAILALSEGGNAPRGRIRAALWGDFNHDKATANLRQLIARIHRVEDRAGLRLLTLIGDTVGLTAGVSIDCCGLVAMLRQRGDHERLDQGTVAERCDRLARRWSGALLEGLSFGEAAVDEWLEGSREHLRLRFIDAARGLLAREPDPAHRQAQWDLAQRIIELDATEETAYRALMRLCIAQGDRGFALRIFGRCKRILAEQLGVEPESATVALAAQLRDPDTLRPVQSPSVGGSVGARTPPARNAGRQVPVVMIMPPAGAALDEMLGSVAAGLAEEITLGLTRFRRFSIVAPQAAGVMTLKERCREENLSIFDVDYAVALSLMPGAHGYRLIVRLTDVSKSEVLWGTDIEFTVATLGSSFDRLIGLTVRTLVDAVDTHQLRLAASPETAPAYALCVQARRLLRKSDLQAIRRAKKLFKQALALVADYTPAIVGIARAGSEEFLVRGMTQPDLLQESIRLAARASELDPLDGRARRELGLANLYMRRYDESLEAFDAAMRLNPDDADILSDYADALAHSGEPRRGLPMSRKALELNPAQPDDYVWTLGSIHYQLGDYQTALDSLRPMEGSPATARLLSACAAQSGHKDLAERYSQVVRETYPEFEVESVRRIVPNRNSADAAHLIDGLRLAGLA